MRRLIWLGIAFVAILPPHGYYILTTLPLLLILGPFALLTVWAVLPAPVFWSLVHRAMRAWRRDSYKWRPEAPARPSQSPEADRDEVQAPPAVEPPRLRLRPPN